MDIVYRSLRPHERKIYRSIRLESLKEFPEAYATTYKESASTTVLGIETAIEDQIPTTFVMGAFINEELVGIWTFVQGQDDSGGLYQMYVKREQQGKHIAFQLIAHTIAEAKHRYNTTTIFLEVAKYNTPALQLYLKAGFVITTETNGLMTMKFQHQDVAR